MVFPYARVGCAARHRVVADSNHLRHDACSGRRFDDSTRSHHELSDKTADSVLTWVAWADRPHRLRRKGSLTTDVPPLRDAYFAPHQSKE
jgi:hypothetical protein